MTRQFKVVVERHPDGYVAYPLGLKGVVVGQGDTYRAALDDVTSAIRFHMETFGTEVIETEGPVLEAFVAKAEGRPDAQVPRRRSSITCRQSVRRVGIPNRSYDESRQPAGLEPKLSSLRAQFTI
jgi:predicted RNase H-like HicB family nuclease